MSKYPKEEMEDLSSQLQQIKEQLHQTGVCTDDFDTLVERYNEKLRQAAESDGSDPEKLVTDLLTRCLIWSELIKKKLAYWILILVLNTHHDRPGRITEGFEDQFEKLLNIRNQLESRQLLQSWSLRETDLYSYQRQLDRIDESRTLDGNFINPQGGVADLQTERVSFWNTMIEHSN